MGDKTRNSIYFKVFSPALLLISIILIAIRTSWYENVVSKWKDENSRITEINELFYHIHMLQTFVIYKKTKIIVIEDFR